MVLEVEYVNHCDNCDLGHAIYNCPKCNRVNVDYGELWWNRDTLDNVNIKCDSCAQDFLLMCVNGKYQIIFKYTVESNDHKKLPHLSPKMLILTNKNKVDCASLETYFNEMSFELGPIQIREFVCHKIEIKENLIMLTTKASEKIYYLIAFSGNSMYYTIIENENTKPSFQKWVTFRNDMTYYYVGDLKFLMKLDRDEDPIPPMFPPNIYIDDDTEITFKNYTY